MLKPEMLVSYDIFIFCFPRIIKDIVNGNITRIRIFFLLNYLFCIKINVNIFQKKCFYFISDENGISFSAVTAKGMFFCFTIIWKIRLVYDGP